MDISEATEIVKNAYAICPNLWFYIKTADGQFKKKRLVINANGELRGYRRKSPDKLMAIDTSEWIRLRPRYTQKTQLFHNNMDKMLLYLSKSGLWENLYNELVRLNEIPELKLLDLYDAAPNPQRQFLKENGYQIITLKRFRDILYNIRCVTSIWYGKEGSDVKKEYKEAIETKTDFSRQWKVKYNNSINFQSSRMVASFSEMHSSQETGYYYILLDDMHIAFQQNPPVRL